MPDPFRQKHADYVASCESQNDDCEYVGALENEWHLLGLGRDGSRRTASSHEQRRNTGVQQVMST